jgi:glycosyltransferase involved in cell wall biosynthesis
MTSPSLLWCGVGNSIAPPRDSGDVTKDAVTATVSAPLPAVVQKALYFASETPAPPGARRILLISYNFPPDPAVGGLRWQQMARYFAEWGWAMDVIARDFRQVDSLDTARLSHMPAGTRIFCVPDTEPLIARVQRFLWRPIRRMIGHIQNSKGYALSQSEIQTQRGFRSKLRAYLAWIEVSRGRNWARATARLGGEIARSQKYVAIVSSGPPHMAHEGGRLLSRKTGLPHVVDMRDPWSLVRRVQEAIASRLWLRLAAYYERRVMKHASLVTLNTLSSRDAMKVAYPQHAAKFEVVRNGCDNEPLPPTKRDKRFRLRFAGSIYLDRDPRNCFKAAKRLITELNLTPQQFLIEFVGQVYRYAGIPTLQIAQEEGIKEYVRVSGLVPRKEALEFLAGATMLLSLPQDSDFAVPAKIFEYVRFEAWMLVLATTNSATGQLLANSDADVLDHADIDGITCVLRQRYQQFLQGERPLPIGRDGRFDRSIQAKKMMDLLVSRCSSAVAVPSVSAALPTPASVRLDRHPRPSPHP